MLGGLLGSTYGKVLGLYEGIKLGCTYIKMRGIIIGIVNGFTLWCDDEKELVSLDGSYDGSHEVKIYGLLFGDSFGSTYSKVLGSDESINLVSTYSEFLDTILGDVDVIIFDHIVGT